MSEELKNDNYSADSIQALEGMEHVRMRPCILEIGFEDPHHLVYEVVDNSIDEAMEAIMTIVADINEDGLLLLKIMDGIPWVSIKKKGLALRL
jgi:DNA gyrase subunit B